MRKSALHRAAAALGLLAWFSVNPGCASILGVETPSDTCSNGLKDKGETGIDCGGVCIGGCADAACTDAADCASAHCDNGKCIEAACDDGLWNGPEVSVDKCPEDFFCVNSRCRPGTCFNNMLDSPDEPDADCGGKLCGACNGSVCKTGPDCASETCTGGTCQCGLCSELLTSHSGKVSLPSQCHKDLATKLINCLCFLQCPTQCGQCASALALASTDCKSCLSKVTAICADPYSRCQADH